MFLRQRRKEVVMWRICFKFKGKCRYSTRVFLHYSDAEKFGKDKLEIFIQPASEPIPGAYVNKTKAFYMPNHGRETANRHWFGNRRGT